MSDADEYVEAEEAAAMLGVTVATLYAYVSRGRIRSVERREGGRRRLYAVADVVRWLEERGRQRPSGPLHWGQPVLDSAITRVADGRLLYRERDAVELARTASLEAVAMLIWTGELAQPFPAPRRPLLPSAMWEQVRVDTRELRAIEAFQVLLPLAGALDGSVGQRPRAVCRAGAHALRLMALIAGGPPGSPSIAAGLQRAWSPERAADARLIDAALVLSAEHELNVSSFAARCVASTGADPYAVVTSGLAALSGPRHGGHVDRVAALLAEALDVGAAAAIDRRLARGETVPGFEHRLYPDGDPRGAELVGRTAAAFPDHPAVAVARELCELAAGRVGGHPTLDTGLVVLCRALPAAPDPLALFAIGRTVGWIGHALEQYATGELIRPRARYVGGQAR